MSRSPVARGDARERILHAAGTLIARHGVDGVSIRAINAEAGVSPGILHYHFGSLDSVVEALLERHMLPLIAARERMLESLAQKPVISIHDIVGILVLPLASKLIEEGDEGLRYIRLLARLHSDRDPHLADIPGLAPGAPRNFLPQQLARALPEIDAATLKWRTAMASHTLLHALAELNEELPQDDAERFTAMQWSRVHNLVEFLCAGFSAPIPHRTLENGTDLFIRKRE